MSAGLHRAIRDAIATTPAYREKAILVSQVLQATSDLAGKESDLYDAVHALFRALPDRLVRGSMFLVATQDVDDGVELSWDSREEPRPGYAPGQGLHDPYDPGEAVARALRLLEQSCNARAGYVRASYEEINNSSAFPRAPYLHRRVVAHLPLSPAAAAARARIARAEPSVSVEVESPSKKTDDDGILRSLWPRPRTPLARAGRR